MHPKRDGPWYVEQLRQLAAEQVKRVDAWGAATIRTGQSDEQLLSVHKRWLNLHCIRRSTNQVQLEIRREACPLGVPISEVLLPRWRCSSFKVCSAGHLRLLAVLVLPRQGMDISKLMPDGDQSILPPGFALWRWGATNDLGTFHVVKEF